jgi:hypothetical protein
MSATNWRQIATYSSGLEADMALQQLEAAGIPALRDSHDSVGVFGFGFQGSTGSGFTILVPDTEYEPAREILALGDDQVTG